MPSSRHSWEPLALHDVADLFEPAQFRWWISGGHALELHLDRSWRSHDDIDIGVSRREAPLVYDLLHDWEISVAAAGMLSPWSGTELRVDQHQNNLWARRRATAPWSMDITISDGDPDTWIYRRDPAIRRPWDTAVLHSVPTGLPYLVPDLQLLFKSKQPRPKDDADAAEVIPELNGSEADFLFNALGPDHHWVELRT